jgi:hypothetical protein
MTDKETMQLALDALNESINEMHYLSEINGWPYEHNYSNAIEALKKALARPERKALTDAECTGIVNNNSYAIEGCVYHSPYGIISDVEEFYGIKETE